MNIALLYQMEMMRKRRIAAAGGGSTPLTLTALTAGSKVTLNKGWFTAAVSLEYSTGGAWSTYTIGTEITLTSAGDYIKFRGDNNTFSTTANDYYQFVMSGTIGASGNVMSLVDSTCKLLTIPCDLLYYPASSPRHASLRMHIPYTCACITRPRRWRQRVAMTMFYGCTSLTTAPAYPPRRWRRGLLLDMF